MTECPPSNDESPDRVQELADEKQPPFLVEFLEFLIHNKKWWLIPIMVVLLLFGLLVVLTSSPAAPFIYPL